MSVSRYLLFRVMAVLLLTSATLAMPQSVVFQPNKNLYSETSNATADITSAVKQAHREHKRVLLDFGGNWCGDCQVLDFYYRQSPNAEILSKHYVVVHIDIGHMDRNLDVARRYKVPVTRGVPALAILDGQGNLLYSEREKEFEHTSAADVTTLLNRWKS